MKRFTLLVMTMGVLLLQNCTAYRIKVAHHGEHFKYYFPQKRNILGEWSNIKTPTGEYTYEWAKNIIDIDKKPKQKNITYIK